MSQIVSITLNDIFNIDHLIDAQISPDGTQIAFVVKQDYIQPEEQTPLSIIWQVQNNSSAAPPPINFEAHSSMNPRWHPTELILAFLSDKQEAGIYQIYVQDQIKNQIRQITTATSGVNSFEWSPDGCRIAYLTRDNLNKVVQSEIHPKNDAIYLDKNYTFTRLGVIDVFIETETLPQSQIITPPEYEVRDFTWYKDGWAILTSPMATKSIRGLIAWLPFLK